MPFSLTIDARTLATLDDLSLLARTVVEGFLDGLHRSPFLGYSTEFSAYRAYTQGDNLRYIDWKLWARTDEWYVKQFEDDTNLRGHIFLDTSASMNFGEGSANKFDYGRILAAALAELMVRQRDAPGLVLFSEQARQVAQAQATRRHADEIFQLLTQANANGGTRPEATLDGIVDGLNRRGLAVVISDLMTTRDGAVQLLRGLHAQRQETILFHLLAPEELDFPFEGDCLFEDSETAEQIPVQADDFRDEYLKRLHQFCADIREDCVRLEIDYQQVRTDQPLDIALAAYLERRAGL